MASTIFQNCQRGTVFICFIFAVLFFIMTTISLIKKKLDPQDEESGDSKYKQGEKKEGEPKQQDVVKAESKEHKKGENSSIELQFDQIVTNAKPVDPNDSPLQKVLKRFNELQMLYFPILIVFPLNLIIGTSKAFHLVNYFFVMIACLVFNVFKLHESCIEHKCLKVILQNIWLGLLFFELLNVWSTTPVLQPYIVTV